MKNLHNNQKKSILRKKVQSGMTCWKKTGSNLNQTQKDI